MWLMTRALTTTGTMVSTATDLTWSIFGSSDFNGDGKSDILWRNRATGENVIWLMNGTSISSGATFSKVDVSWCIVGVGGFEKDGKADSLWRNNTTGKHATRLLNGATTPKRARL